MRYEIVQGELQLVVSSKHFILDRQAAAEISGERPFSDWNADMLIHLRRIITGRT